MRRVLVVAVALLLGACGGEGGTLRSDLLAATAVVAAPADGVVFEGRDVSGDVIDATNAQPRLEIFRVEGGQVMFLQGATAPAGPLIFSRDPLAAGASAPLIEQATTLVAIIRPLITPTVGGVVFDAWLVALDGSGQVVASEWEGEEHDRLVRLLAWGDDPVEILGAAVEALAARQLGRPIDPGAAPLLEILDG